MSKSKTRYGGAGTRPVPKGGRPRKRSLSYTLHHEDRWPLCEAFVALYQARADRILKACGFDIERTRDVGKLTADFKAKPDASSFEHLRAMKRKKYRYCHFSTNRPEVPFYLNFYQYLNWPYGTEPTDGVLGGHIAQMLEEVAQRARGAAKALRADMRKHPSAYERLPTVAEFFKEHAPDLKWVTSEPKVKQKRKPKRQPKLKVLKFKKRTKAA